jgi:hypothetical protein
LRKKISALASKISGIESQEDVRRSGEPWYRKLRVARSVNYELQHQTTTT